MIIMIRIHCVTGGFQRVPKVIWTQLVPKVKKDGAFSLRHKDTQNKDTRNIRSNESYI